MLVHERVWAALDALAERYSLSPSALARRAGLDPTAFNRSKRYSPDGRPRWPSTESLAKVLDATGASWREFIALLEGSDTANDGLRHRGITGFAEANATQPIHLERATFPGVYLRHALPTTCSEETFAFIIKGKSMLPLYRDGDMIIVDPTAPVRSGQRVFVRTNDGEEIVRILARVRATHIELVTPNLNSPLRIVEREQVGLLARIIWASQ